MNELWHWIASSEDLARIGQVGLAMLLGGAIGIERELARKPAGLRTMMLVSGASALLVALSQLLVDSFEQETLRAMQADPVRVIHAIVIGVSFLGAGTIFRSRDSDGTHGVEGLTTSATILIAAAVGVAVALSEYVLAVGVALLVLLVLIVFAQLEQRMVRSVVESSEPADGETAEDTGERSVAGSRPRRPVRHAQ